MRAGMAKRNITPKESIRMAGFDRRTQPSTGTLDELHVSALALEDENKQLFVLCSFDLLGTNRTLCQRIRQALALPKGRLWICATHTHSAPSAAFWDDSEYAAWLVDQAAEAVKEAIADLQPARALAADTQATGVASLRNQGRSGAEYAMPLRLLQWQRESDVLTLCHFACHPTVLDERNLLYSKDLPGAAAADERMIFINGACADLSTRFTRKASSPEELRRLGGIMQHAIKEARWQTDECLGQSIRTAEKDIFLSRTASLEGQEHAALLSAFRQKAEQCADRQARREYDSIIAVLERTGAEAESARPIHIAAADFGSFALLSLPFEVDSQDGCELERTLAALVEKPVYLICYAGGYDGYLPSGKPLGENSSYEDIASRYLPESRKMVWECAKQCVLDIRNS